MSKTGTVYLVGAGPGDLGLVTLRAKECIERADVIVYDHLANPELLGWARDDAEIICAGKRAGEHALSQEEINALLVEKARGGKGVVRLKGGDPFVFGRGAEEAQASFGEHSEPQHWRGKTSSAACRDGVARSGLEPHVACGSPLAPTRVRRDSSQGVSARLGRAVAALFRAGSAFATDGFV